MGPGTRVSHARPQRPADAVRPVGADPEPHHVGHDQRAGRGAWVRRCGGVDRDQAEVIAKRDPEQSETAVLGPSGLLGRTCGLSGWRERPKCRSIGLLRKAIGGVGRPALTGAGAGHVAEQQVTSRWCGVWSAARSISA